MTDDALLAEWREQEAQRDRTRYSFAEPEEERCEAVCRDSSNPLGLREEWANLLYRCGKRKGHEGRHDCADEGWTVKWGSDA